jgi:hypothetical protein
MDIETAGQFIHLFDQLRNSLVIMEAWQLTELNKQAHQCTLSLRTFKLDLLERILLGKVGIGLTPTFINHMVNELDEYIKILDEHIKGKPVPRYHALHHDLLCGSYRMAAGHAATLAMDLDAVEKRLIKKSDAFEQHFNEFFLKAIELTGNLRTLNKQCNPAKPRVVNH